MPADYVFVVILQATTNGRNGSSTNGSAVSLYYLFLNIGDNNFLLCKISSS